MHCPTLAKLSPPPTGKTGWPWTEESPHLPATMPDGSSWPKVSIVTPSYNQGQFLEETIRSVLLQGYPNLEYIIMDGGSTDNSVDIIRKYEPWLAYWVSEKDRGQSHALNKGFQRATGAVMAWLNSDDWYQPDILSARVAALVAAPERVLVYGDCQVVDSLGRAIRTWRTAQCGLPSLLLDANQIPQPGALMRGSAVTAVGGVDEALHYSMDYILWLRLCRIGEPFYLPGIAANFRHHTISKSVSDGYKFYEEKLKWLSSWPDLTKVLSENQRMEMMRRLYVKTALEYLFASDTQSTQKYLTLALQERELPYGDLDTLAQQILAITGLNGQTIQNTPAHYQQLRSVLRRVKPTVRGHRLSRRVASQYYMGRVFAQERSHTVSGKELWRGIWYDPRWLANIGVVSRVLETLFGKQIMNWIRPKSAQLMAKIGWRQ